MAQQLFKRLSMLYPPAREEDYFQDGIWNERLLKLDTELLVAHLGPGSPFSVENPSFREKCKDVGVCYACYSGEHKMDSPLCQAKESRKDICRVSVNLDKDALAKKDKAELDEIDYKDLKSRFDVLMAFRDGLQVGAKRRRISE
jgi:hypothetical protein